MYVAFVLVPIMSLFIENLSRQNKITVPTFSSVNSDYKSVCTSHLSIFATCAAHLLGLATRIIFGDLYKSDLLLHG